MVTLHESHVAWAELRAGAVSDRARRRARRASTTRPGRAAATSTTGGSARRAGRGRAGRCDEHAVAGSLADAGRGRARRAEPRARGDPGRRGGAGRRAGRLGGARGAGAGGRRLRLVVLVHMPLGGRRDADGRDRASGRCSRPPRPWSRPAGGPATGCSSATPCRPSGCTWPQPGVDPAAAGAGYAAGRRAAVRRRGHPGQGPRRAARGAGRGRRPAWRCALRRQPWTATRRTSPGCRAGRRAPASATGSGSPGR